MYKGKHSRNVTLRDKESKASRRTNKIIQIRTKCRKRSVIASFSRNVNFSNTNGPYKRKKPYQKKEKKEQIKQIRNEALDGRLKFPDTSRHRDQGRAESRQKRVAAGEEGREEKGINIRT